MKIRLERPADAAVIRYVNEQAFGRIAEADLVDRLRGGGKHALSLVAETDGQIVGHILFSPVTIEAAEQASNAAGLAPMAVLPECQRLGIGSALVRTGLERCRELGFNAAVVLGHPHFYPRFGFAPASRFGLRCEYAVPDEVFMALELCAGALTDCAGLVKYQPEFNEV